MGVKRFIEKHASLSLPTIHTNLSQTGPCIDSTPWTTEEQKLLEQALKTYPVNTPERWEKIAEAVPGRTKKDCMRRYKVMALTDSHSLDYGVASALLCAN
jgi:hypothetical protein